MADAEKIAAKIVTDFDDGWEVITNIEGHTSEGLWFRNLARNELTGAIAKAITEAVDAALERAAQVADIWADTKPVLHASSNPATATAIASIISDTGSKIAAAIRKLHPETV
jgi:predicted RNase H-related nuclease YkuK (DUF458 family)